ncbi:hypothetical protein [Paenibacillus sp. NFR01]|uniref:hypothetical protein n=1 Tax=Paenibacillus sp. NFR01 TaxID=1566279 RepID=UPI0008B19DC4|nr:hypothetical protein [Paenibacillus sp. NFR01]SEU19506.1 hypothetical protein SAMN03159358_3890 [Paenibacillus sp. NFR01]
MLAISLLLIWVAATALILLYYYPFPKKDSGLSRTVPPAHLIPSANRVDLQQHVKCAAFSSAYVLRHFGTFIREVPGKRYLHFVPVVGYDEVFFYLADSLAYRANCKETLYNRKISIGELQALWQTWLPFNRNSYIIVQRAETGGVK